MTTTNGNLTDVIAQLVRSKTKASRKLSRGLVLAYTPGSENDGVYRFTCSRRGVSPSDREMQIVERDLRAALKGEGRAHTGLRCEPWLKKKTRRGVYQYHLWTWEELKQGELL